MDRRKSMRAPWYTHELPELLYTAIVVGSVGAAMYGLFDLFNLA